MQNKRVTRSSTASHHGTVSATELTDITVCDILLLSPDTSLVKPMTWEDCYKDSSVAASCLESLLWLLDQYRCLPCVGKPVVVIKCDNGVVEVMTRSTKILRYSKLPPSTLLKKSVPYHFPDKWNFLIVNGDSCVVDYPIVGGRQYYDMAICSPPYNIGWEYNGYNDSDKSDEDYIQSMVQVATKLDTKIKQSGVWVLNLSYSVRNTCLHDDVVRTIKESTGWKYSEKIIWKKPRALPIMGRFTRICEEIFVLKRFKEEVPKNSEKKDFYWSSAQGWDIITQNYVETKVNNDADRLRTSLVW